jgi:hypothetical protein
MSDEGYDFSSFNLPPARGLDSPKPTTKTEPTARPIDQILAREGLTQVTLPGRKGKDSIGIERPGEETMLVRNIPNHIIKQIESSFRTSGREAVLSFGHYVGAIQGSELMDSKGIAHLKKLAHGFAEADKPEEFFNENIRPHLQSLTMKAR